MSDWYDDEVDDRLARIAAERTPTDSRVAPDPTQARAALYERVAAAIHAVNGNWSAEDDNECGHGSEPSQCEEAAEAALAALPDDGRAETECWACHHPSHGPGTNGSGCSECFCTQTEYVGGRPLALPDDDREAATFPLDLEAFVAGLDSPNHSDESRRDWCRLFFRDMQRSAAFTDDGREGLVEEVRVMLDTHACFQTDPPLIGVIELRRRLAALAALPDDGQPLGVGQPSAIRADEAVSRVPVAEDDPAAGAVVALGGVDGGAEVLAGAAVSGHLNTSYPSVSGRYSALPDDGREPPSPHELWEQAGGDRDRYLALMREHGHIVPGKRPPGEDIFGHALPDDGREGLDVERLARAMEDVFPGWIEEAPGTAEAQREMRSYAEQLDKAYRWLADSASPPLATPAPDSGAEERLDIARIRREVEYIAAIHADGHGVWTTKEWRSFVLACDMLNWPWLLAALAALPDDGREGLDVRGLLEWLSTDMEYAAKRGTEDDDLARWRQAVRELRSALTDKP